MCLVVYLARAKCKVNPDNIATPIAASAGDLVTMGLLAIISKILHQYLNDNMLVMSLITMSLLVMTPLWAFISWRNEHTKSILMNGWLPILSGMVIQNVGGFIMECGMGNFDKMAAYQPVINGFCGDLVAVHTSKISTYLHQRSVKKVLPESDSKPCVFPWTAFFGQSSRIQFEYIFLIITSLTGPHAKLALLLVLIAAPSQFPFLVMIKYMGENIELTWIFFLAYYVACTLQVSITLYLAYCITLFTWKIGSDPDNCAIPIVTAMADLTGSVFLVATFIFLKEFEDPNALSDLKYLVVD